ncbi:MAG: hypothetical protein AABX01_00495 [Candidatus Micrarchaeota archaeon]
MKNLDSVLLIGALAIFLSQMLYALPITSDSYDNFRIVRELENGKGYPIESTAINGDSTLYPPAFGIALYSFSALTSFPPGFSLSFLSYVFMAIIVYLIFLLIRSATGNESGAVLGAAAIFTLPIVFYRFVTPIAETMGLAVFLLALYAYQKNKFAFLAFILAIFPLVHTRSFVFCLITIGIASLFRKDISKMAKSAALGIAAYMILRLAYPIYAVGFENPSVTEPNLLGMLPLIPMAVMALGLIALMKNKGKFDVLSSSIIFAFFASYFFIPFPFRHAIFLVVPLSFLTAKALGSDRRLVAIYSVFLALAMVQNVQMRAAPFNLQQIEMFREVKNYEGENAIASFSDNYALPYFAGKKVVVGSFAEGLNDGNERGKDLHAYFNGLSEEGKAQLLNKYNINLGIYEKGVYKYNYEEGIADAKLLESNKIAVFSFTKPN